MRRKRKRRRRREGEREPRIHAPPTMKGQRQGFAYKPESGL
jgi:hypothetical protein